MVFLIMYISDVLPASDLGGTCMVNTLPEKIEEGFHENCYPIYSLEAETLMETP